MNASWPVDRMLWFYSFVMWVVLLPAKETASACSRVRRLQGSFEVRTMIFAALPLQHSPRNVNDPGSCEMKQTSIGSNSASGFYIEQGAKPR